MVPFSWSISQVGKILPKGLALPPWNHWSLPPDTLHFLLLEIRENKPEKVVEFGSGISTICMGALLKTYGGKLFSIEHDPEYADMMRREVQNAGLTDVVEIRIAQITENADTPFGHPWYDMSGIADLHDIDLVLVDGPPMSFGQEVRYPGIAVMRERLSPTGKIICDDTKRPGEIAIKSALLERFDDILVTDIPMSRGCYVVELK